MKENGMTADARRKAAGERAKACAGQSRRVDGSAAPAGGARSLPFQAKELRAELVERDGRQFFRVDGYASVVERGYEMYDFFGPYEEIVDKAAFDKTLAASPDVAFLTNHRGVTMARTTNGTLELSIDSLGLRSTAWLNPERQDVRDLTSAITDRLITEMSFAFMLNDGTWNDDFDEFRILEVDIDRGDVSAVNYGANPYTSIAARSREIMHDLRHLPAGAKQAAMRALQGDDPATAAVAARSFPLAGVPDWSARLRGAHTKLREQRALSPQDAAIVGQVLGWLTAIDNIVDEGQETLAAYLGVPNPDMDDDMMSGMGDMPMQQNSAPAKSEARDGKGMSIELAEAFLGIDG